ncbi:MAG: gltP [Sphingomonas bacterium]|nr:dicarboxylate/amino acid:cation symporter [Sphingomonas bacterium]MDB5688188.1 gltP [Sphingomonas bacterium]
MSPARPAGAASLAPARRPRIPAHLRIFVGLAVGTAGGLAANLLAPHAAWIGFIATNVTQPIGSLFLRLLFILVLPLLFTAVISGIAAVRDVDTLRRLATRALAYMIGATVLAVLIGLAAVNLFRPGDGIDPTVARQMLAATAGTHAIGAAGESPRTGLNAVVDLLPAHVLGAASQGSLIGAIILALLIGIGLLLIQTDRTRRIVSVVEGLFQVGMRLIELVMRFAPLAVLCFMFDLTLVFGWQLLAILGAYVGVVLLALLLHLTVVCSGIVWMGGGMRPSIFFRATQEAAFVAFSTASSHATLPTSLKVAEERLKLPSGPARFLLGIGASANQAGTAIYQSVTVVFLTQALGVQLSLSQQFLVLAICSLGGIGTAGLPAGSLPLVATILAIVGVPPELLGLLLGVDRLLDMCRTVVNVTGDLAIAAAVAR